MVTLLFALCWKIFSIVVISWLDSLDDPRWHFEEHREYFEKSKKYLDNLAGDPNRDRSELKELCNDFDGIRKTVST